jgi:transcriptional regulator with AAA-type ATPase domain
MRIIIEHDDGKRETFQDVTDAFLAARQLRPMQGEEGDLALLPHLQSWSWGNNVRELLKELRQAVVELEDYLRRQHERSS